MQSIKIFFIIHFKLFVKINRILKLPKFYLSFYMLEVV